MPVADRAPLQLKRPGDVLPLTASSVLTLENQTTSFVPPLSRLCNGEQAGNPGLPAVVPPLQLYWPCREKNKASVGLISKISGDEAKRHGERRSAVTRCYLYAIFYLQSHFKRLSCLCSPFGNSFTHQNIAGLTTESSGW